MSIYTKNATTRDFVCAYLYILSFVFSIFFRLWYFSTNVKYLSCCFHVTTLSSFSFWKCCRSSICPPGAGTGDVGVVIVDSSGRRDTVEIVLENKGDSIFRCTYVPVLEGPHTVYVTFAGQQIPRSPFTVHISEGRFYTFVSTPVSSDLISFSVVSIFHVTRMWSLQIFGPYLVHHLIWTA